MGTTQPAKTPTPRSLTWLFQKMIGANDSDFADRWGRSMDGNPHYSEVGRTHGSLRKTARALKEAKTQVAYWHLESLAHLRGVPASVLLLFSRLRSNFDEGNLHDSEVVVGALKAILETFDPAEEPTMAMFERWSEEFALAAAANRSSD